MGRHRALSLDLLLPSRLDPLGDLRSPLGGLALRSFQSFSPAIELFQPSSLAGQLVLLLRFDLAKLEGHLLQRAQPLALVLE